MFVKDVDASGIRLKSFSIDQVRGGIGLRIGTAARLFVFHRTNISMYTEDLVEGQGAKDVRPRG